MRVLIACGGTAGHIFSGLALAEELRSQEKDCQITIVVSTRHRDREYLRAGGLVQDTQIETVYSYPLPYRISLKYVYFSLGLLRGAVRSIYLILKYRPEVVVGFGGYAAFAPLIVAHIMGIPTLIHEQNLIPGRANRLLARMADRVAVTFDETNKFFPRINSGHKIVKTGLPLRRDILASLASKETKAKNKLTILVSGGSQGAHNINKLVLDCLALMKAENRRKIHLIHLTGKRDFEFVQARYKELGISSSVFGFLEDMTSVYRITDLLISRSGAATIFEAACFGLPCILIPHSYGTKHQQENAFFLQRVGAAIVLDERVTSARNLESLLCELINSEVARQTLSQKIKMLHEPLAGDNLKEQVFALYRGDYVRR